MTTRKVTAAEEKVLTLAVEWAERRDAWDNFYKSGAWKLNDEKARDAIVVPMRATEARFHRASSRLLKQRRAKGAHK